MTYLADRLRTDCRGPRHRTCTPRPEPPEPNGLVAVACRLRSRCRVHCQSRHLVRSVRLECIRPPARRADPASGGACVPVGLLSRDRRVPPAHRPPRIVCGRCRPPLVRWRLDPDSGPLDVARFTVRDACWEPRVQPARDD